MSSENDIYMLTKKIGIAFPPSGQEMAQKVGQALAGAGFTCTLAQQITDSHWYLTVDPGYGPEGRGIPKAFANQIANDAHGVFSGSSVASLMNDNARKDRRSASGPSGGAMKPRGPRP